MANYISKHSGAEIDTAIEQVQYKINKPEGALKDEVLIFDGSNWISSNFINKHNTPAIWDAMTNYIPDKGEIIVYDKDDNTDYERFKIGDGVKTVSQLPFYMADLREHTQNTDIHITTEERATWNAVQSQVNHLKQDLENKIDNKVSGKLDQTPNTWPAWTEEQ